MKKLFLLLVLILTGCTSNNDPSTTTTQPPSNQTDLKELQDSIQDLENRIVYLENENTILTVRLSENDADYALLEKQYLETSKQLEDTQIKLNAELAKNEVLTQQIVDTSNLQYRHDLYEYYLSNDTVNTYLIDEELSEVVKTLILDERFLFVVEDTLSAPYLLYFPENITSNSILVYPNMDVTTRPLESLIQFDEEEYSDYLTFADQVGAPLFIPFMQSYCLEKDSLYYKPNTLNELAVKASATTLRSSSLCTTSEYDGDLLLSNTYRFDREFIYLLDDAIDRLTQMNLNPESRIFFGAYDSATFINNFSLLHPGEIDVTISINAGIIPAIRDAYFGTTFTYPIGIYNYEETFGNPFDLENYQAIQKYNILSDDYDFLQLGYDNEEVLTKFAKIYVTGDNRDYLELLATFLEEEQNQNNYIYLNKHNDFDLLEILTNTLDWIETANAHSSNDSMIVEILP